MKLPYLAPVIEILEWDEEDVNLLTASMPDKFEVMDEGWFV